ncbi:proline dehydrogenase family protein [Microlunatus sp. Y2014]|uniref:proline dehydrogenase family protein n=1 Tax=Microlunatus sp. Y2014 TaxID=3418488 RepID=UPI003DA781DD
MLRSVLVAASRQPWLKQAALSLPMTNAMINSYVAGDDIDDAVATAGRLHAAGLMISIDRLGEDVTEAAQADQATAAYVDLLAALARTGLTGTAEVSVKLSALGQQLATDTGTDPAADNLRAICLAAETLRTTVTVDMEDHTRLDDTLATVTEVRRRHPDLGVVLQAYLHRSEADCRELAVAGSRVRLCKGAYDEPPEVAITDRHQVDLSYVRCLRELMRGDGYPMVATHDPRLIEIAQDLAIRYDRGPGDFEFQMLHGVRPREQARLVNAGHRVRVYLPYGTDWYGYLVRRLAERPSNLLLFLRSLVQRG